VRKLTLVALLLVLVSLPAQALVMQLGDLRFKIINYDVGTLYSPTGPYTYANATQADANKLAQCPGAYPLTYTPSGTDGVEDTWGILYVTQIYDVNDPLNPFWTADPNKEEITGIFYDVEDLFVKKLTGQPTAIYGQGFKLDLYYDTTPDFDATGGVAARTSQTQYPTATDGQKLLSIVGAPGSFYADSGGMVSPSAQVLLAASFRSSFDFSTNSGSGDVYADVVPGSGPWADTTDSGMVGSILKHIPAVAWDGTNWTLRDNPGTKDDAVDWVIHFTTQPTNVADWLVLSNDPAATYYIPEPGSMALLGLGLLALVRRRRRSK